MIEDNLSIILRELESVFISSDFTNQHKLVSLIAKSDRIVCLGAGRVGYATKGFAMRLKHLGLDSYMVGDSNVPSLRKKDLLMVSSGSGETETIFRLTKIAKKNNTKIALITGNPSSRIGKLADLVLLLKAPSKTNKGSGPKTIQPMTTLNEQALGLLYDALVLMLMKKLSQTNARMKKRHSILE